MDTPCPVGPAPRSCARMTAIGNGSWFVSGTMQTSTKLWSFWATSVSLFFSLDTVTSRYKNVVLIPKLRGIGEFDALGHRCKSEDFSSATREQFAHV